MKRNLMHFAIIAGLLAVTGTTAFAQNLKAHIPFEFQVSGVTLPAGAYSVNRIDSQFNGWTVRHVPTKKAAMVLSPSSAKSRPLTESTKGQLVFRCAGSNCAMQSLYAPGSTTGYAFNYKMRDVDPNVKVAIVRIPLGD